jgi:integrase
VAAHIKQRGSTWYLVDGATRLSLKTSKKGLAEHRLEEYIKGKYGLKPTPTVGEFYSCWIESKVEPLYRRALVRDYRVHFNAYILPAFKHVRLAAITTKDLNDFRVKLLKRLAVKTARNIIDGSFRAMYRDARLEIEALQGKDPFIDIQWPRLSRKKPAPFTAEERDRILAWWLDNDCFYYPWVAWQFYTGMRPSETAALTWADVNLEAGTVSINKSRNMGTTAATKTANSERIIPVDEPLLAILKLLPSRELGLEHVFVGKRGDPMSKKWAQHNWKGCLDALGIVRRRPFYNCRHTVITELVKAGHNLKAIADYVGTSVAMIEANYCARQGLNLAQNSHSSQPNYLENMVAGPGFEPGTSRL